MDGGQQSEPEEISGALRTRWEGLSETPRAAPTQSAKQPTNQTNKTEKTKKKKKKHPAGQRRGRRGTHEVGHKRRKRAEEKGVKHRTRVREHKVNCLTQRVKDKGRRGGSERSPLLPPVRRSQRRGQHKTSKLQNSMHILQNVYIELTYSEPP